MNLLRFRRSRIFRLHPWLALAATALGAWLLNHIEADLRMLLLGPFVVAGLATAVLLWLRKQAGSQPGMASLPRVLGFSSCLPAALAMVIFTVLLLTLSAPDFMGSVLQFLRWYVPEPVAVRLSGLLILTGVLAAEAFLLAGGLRLLLGRMVREARVLLVSWSPVLPAIVLLGLAARSATVAGLALVASLLLGGWLLGRALHRPALLPRPWRGLALCLPAGLELAGMAAMAAVAGSFIHPSPRSLTAVWQRSLNQPESEGEWLGDSYGIPRRMASLDDHSLVASISRMDGTRSISDITIYDLALPRVVAKTTVQGEGWVFGTPSGELLISADALRLYHLGAGAAPVHPVNGSATAPLRWNCLRPEECPQAERTFPVELGAEDVSPDGSTVGVMAPGKFSLRTIPDVRRLASFSVGILDSISDDAVVGRTRGQHLSYASVTRRDGKAFNYPVPDDDGRAAFVSNRVLLVYRKGGFDLVDASGRRITHVHLGGSSLLAATARSGRSFALLNYHERPSDPPVPVRMRILVETMSGNTIGQVPIPGDHRVRAAALSPDGRLLAIRTDVGITVYRIPG